MLKPKKITLISLLFLSVSSYADFSVLDESNDDNGAGDILYPVNNSIVEGELDLIKFEVKKQADNHQLIFEFRKPLSSPKNKLSRFGGTALNEIVKNDFYTLNIDVYIDTDRKPNSGFVQTLPGRQALLANEFAWEKAIIVTPRPYAAQSMHHDYLVKTKIETLSNSDQTLDSDVSAKIEKDVETSIKEHYLFATKIKVKKNKVIVTIPNAFISTLSTDWAYSVLISAADIETRFQMNIAAPNFILLTQPGKNTDSLGLKLGARVDASPIVDVLDSHGYQRKWLNNLLLDSDTNRYFSVLGAVVPSKINEVYTGELTKPNVFDVSGHDQPKEENNLSIKDRLKRLQVLREENLVSDDEYNQIRKKIIESL